MAYLGIDIGGTYLKFGILDEEFRVRKTWKKDTLNIKEKDDFYDYLCEGISGYDIEMIGVSAPGVIHSETTEVLSKAASTIAVMYQTNIQKELEKRLHKPVGALNDAKAAAYCELRKGNGKGSKSSAYWLIGTGIGGCICLGEKIISGKDGIAGEFSHIPISVDGHSVESMGDITSIKALISLYNQKRCQTQESVKYGEEVVRRYLKGDVAAAEAMESWLQRQIQGLYILISVYNPEVICIGGGISEEKWFLDKLRKEFYEVNYRFSDLITTRIVPCKYYNQANLIGAVLYVHDGLCK